MKDGRTMENALWCDLETDAERIEFIKCGRCWDTGIIARSMEPQIIELLEFRSNILLSNKIVDL